MLRLGSHSLTALPPGGEVSDREKSEEEIADEFRDWCEDTLKKIEE